MGIVASLAAAPAAYDIIQDERIRDQERLIEEDVSFILCNPLIYILSRGNIEVTFRFQRS